LKEVGEVPQNWEKKRKKIGKDHIKAGKEHTRLFIERKKKKREIPRDRRG